MTAETNNRREKACAFRIPARYVLALLGFLGITLQYTLKVNLSVAIVAMVKKSSNTSSVNSGYSNASEEDICPIEEGSTVTDERQEGEFDWDEALQGHLLAAYFYGYIATQLLGGHAAERFGGKLVFGPGVFLTGVLTLASAAAARSSIYAFMALRVLEGAASGVVIPSMQTMFSQWYPPEERSRFSGIIFSSINFGSLVGMGLSGLLADAGGWPLVFYCSGGLTVLWFVPWMLFTYDSPVNHPTISDSEKRYILEGLGQNMEKPKEHRRVPWSHILTSMPVWAGILMHTGSAWVMYTLLSELPTYLNNVLHYNIRDSGVWSALPYLFAWVNGNVCGAASQWLRARGWLSHLAAYRTFNGINAIGSTLALLAITLVECDSTSIIILLVITMVCNSAIYGGSYINHVDLAINFAGTISGLLHTFINIPGIVAPVVIGALINGQQTLSQWKSVFYMGMGVSSGAYLFYLIFGSVEEQSWNQIEENEKQRYKDEEADQAM